MRERKLINLLRLQDNSIQEIARSIGATYSQQESFLGKGKRGPARKGRRLEFGGLPSGETLIINQEVGIWLRSDKMQVAIPEDATYKIEENVMHLIWSSDKNGRYKSVAQFGMGELLNKVVISGSDAA